MCTGKLVRSQSTLSEQQTAGFLDILDLLPHICRWEALGIYPNRKKCEIIYMCVFVCVCLFVCGHAVAQLVQALRYNPEGLGFNSRCCWNFSLTYSFQTHYGPGANSAS